MKMYIIHYYITCLATSSGTYCILNVIKHFSFNYASISNGEGIIFYCPFGFSSEIWGWRNVTSGSSMFGKHIFKIPFQGEKRISLKIIHSMWLYRFWFMCECGRQPLRCFSSSPPSGLRALVTSSPLNELLITNRTQPHWDVISITDLQSLWLLSAVSVCR